MTKNSNSYTNTNIEEYIKAALGRKAENPVVLDVSKLTSVADIFIILSGRSNRHVRSIGEFIREELKKQGIQLLHAEGNKDGQWILLDYDNVIIHVFYEPVREFYDLEGLWGDARRIDVDGVNL